MSRIDVQIEESWKQVLNDEFQQPYFAALRQFLKEEKAAGQVVYPPGPQIFNAFNLTPFANVKVVIIGQDPYHGPGQAHGLCFSVADGVPPPPSLVNIYKELKSDLEIPISPSGNLTKWAQQGVLLLNALLTVRANVPASHHGKGWETFTDAVIRTISEKSSGIVFLLWGKFAQEKHALIDPTKHHILKAAHPSPFSVTKFFGCKHFSKTNELLRSEGRVPIDWKV
ncbi:MAG: uracil-DNA glycosylase [Chitinophagales bacterium]